MAFNLGPKIFNRMLPMLRSKCDMPIKKALPVTLHLCQLHLSRPLSKNHINLQKSLVKVVHTNLNLVNNQYEQYTGIAEIRKIQDKVLEAESNFVDVSKKRRLCQDKIDQLKNKLNNIKEKLETTPRSSDAYIDLITTEHKLLREQLSLDVELEQLKEKEQMAFDIMSKLLRQSHECERLRQDRSKYWSIITLILSFGCSCLAIVAQKVRNQNSIKTSVVSLESSLDSFEQVVEEKVDNLNIRLERLEGLLDTRLLSMEHKFDKLLDAKKETKKSSWISYVPGLAALIGWFVYKGNEM